MKYYLICIVALVLFFKSSTFAITPEFRIEENTDFLEVDNVGNIYIVNKTILKKYNSKGEFLYDFSSNMNGEIKSIDVTNALKILVFYKESNVIIFLNQQLAPIAGSIDIYDIADAEAMVACASLESEFWIYSNETQSVMLFDKQLQMVQESQNLSSWIRKDTIQQIKEQNQRLYLTLFNRIIVLDIFGSYITTIHFKNAQYLKLNTDNISYLFDNKMVVYGLKQKDILKELQIPFDRRIKHIFYQNGKMYLISDNNLFVF